MDAIYRPEGLDLIRCVNNGDAICEECGAVMDREDDPNGGCDIYVCPGCGFIIDEMDYEYKDPNDDHEDDTDWDDEY